MAHSAIKTHNYITAAGETKSVIRLADILKAAGLENSDLAVAFRGGRGSQFPGEMLVMWTAPRVNKDAGASKGAAGPVYHYSPDGKLRWCEGMATWEAVPVKAGPPPLPAPSGPPALPVAGAPTTTPRRGRKAG